MELATYASDENFQLEKRRLFESAEWTLLRLNETISEMRSWTLEREQLQSDVYRLKVALGYAERMLGDSLVQHQSTVIRHLETTNAEMRAKLANLTAALVSAERSVAWSIERKVRSEVAKLTSQVAVEKLQLAREVVYLRNKLSESQVSASMYREITVKLDEYTNEDTQLDTLLVCAGRKLIDTVNKLSSEAIRLIEGRSRADEKNAVKSPSVKHPAQIDELRVLQLERILSKEIDEKNHQLKAFKRVVSGLRTKLTVLARINGKLRGKIEAPVGGTFDAHLKPLITENCEPSHEGEIESQLSRLISEQMSLRSQLNMERTTAREALREFNKSAKTVDQLQRDLLAAKTENTKLKDQNRTLRSLKLNVHKKRQKFFLTTLTHTKLKLRKIIKKSEKAEAERENLTKMVDELKLKNSEFDEEIKNKTKNEESFKNKIFALTEKAETLKYNLSVTQTKYDKLNVDIEEMQKFTNDVKLGELKTAECENLSKIVEQRGEKIDKVPTNFNSLTSLVSALKTENEKLRAAIDAANAKKNPCTLDVKGTSKPSSMSTSSIPAPSSQVECASGVRNFSIQTTSQRISNNVNSPQLKFDTNSPAPRETPPKGETEANNATEKTDEVDEPPDSQSCEKSDEKSKSARCNWTIRCRVQADASEKILSSLEDTDRQLSSLKYELSDVKREIGSLRRQLETKRFTIRRLEGENAALKGEVVKLRSGVTKLEHRAQLESANVKQQI